MTRRSALAAIPAAPAFAAEPPDPLASLRSRSAEARPITAAEREQRLERAQKLMRESNLQAICVGPGTSLTYFTGIRWWGGERLFAMVLPLRGSPFFVVPGFEEGRAREQIARAFTDPRVAVLCWQEHEDPYRLTALGLKERGVAAGRIGMEESMPFVFADGIAKASPAATVSSATPVTAGCRMIKSEHELALMRLAAEVTLAAYRAAWGAVRPGMAQGEFAALIAAAHQRQGFRGGASVQVGEWTALPHGSLTPQVIGENSIMLIDGGCSVEGYSSDLTRTLVLGKPTGRMRRVFEIVRRAEAAALAAARPGVACEDVDRAARKIIEDAGFGPGYRYFTHRTGHGLGMDWHEWPYLTQGNRLPLAPGMTTSDEPGIYILGEFGIRLEDSLYMHSGGASLFTPPSPSFEDPFGRG
jgi:Xaa-Pro dipeptidase